MKLKAAVIQVSGMKYIMEQGLLHGALGKNIRNIMYLMRLALNSSVGLCVIGDNKGFTKLMACA